MKEENAEVLGDGKNAVLMLTTNKSKGHVCRAINAVFISTVEQNQRNGTNWHYS